MITFLKSRAGIAALGLLALAAVYFVQQHRIDALRVDLAEARAAVATAESNEAVVRDAVEDQNQAVQEFAGECRAAEYQAQVRALQAKIAADRERDRIREKPARDAADLNRWLSETFQ